MAVSLRYYQDRGVHDSRAKLRGGVKRLVLISPTGSGKTIVFCYLVARAVELNKRVLVVSHRREIISQTYRKLIDAGLQHSQIGVVLGGVGRNAKRLVWNADDDVWEMAERRPTAIVQLGSRDSIRLRGYDKLYPPDLIVIDEAHESLCPSYMQLAEAFPNAVIVGLTATPWRSDGRGLCELYEDFVVMATPEELMSTTDPTTGLPYLMRPRVFQPDQGDLPDLEGVKIGRSGDYDERELEERCLKPGLIGSIIKYYLEKANGLRAVVFAAGVKHSEKVRDEFLLAGVKAEHLDGSTPIPERAAILSRLQHGQTTIVCSCEALSVGWDMPIVACAILARPTRSITVYLQKAGRVLRPHPDKKEVIILDHAGCSLYFGRPDFPHEYNIDARPKRASRAREDTAKQCPRCGEVAPLGATHCTGFLPNGSPCGYEFPPREQKPLQEQDGELVELLPGQDRRLIKTFERMVTRWREQNMRRMARGEHPVKPGEIYYKWKKRFGDRPLPQGVVMPKFTEEEASARDRYERKRIETMEKYAPPDPKRTEAIADLSQQLETLLNVDW